jgi:hypothetical protein
MLKYKDPDSGEILYRDVGIGIIDPDAEYSKNFRKIAKNFGFCSDCGDEFPKEHLYKTVAGHKTILCLPCLNKEEDDEI